MVEQHDVGSTTFVLMHENVTRMGIRMYVSKELLRIKPWLRLKHQVTHPLRKIMFA